MKMKKNKFTFTYGRKPRGSKTSKKEIFSGIPVFLHSSKSVVGGYGAIHCYHNVFPYPLMFCVSKGSYWASRDAIEQFIESNLPMVKEVLSSYDKNSCFSIANYNEVQLEKKRAEKKNRAIEKNSR